MSHVLPGRWWLSWLFLLLLGWRNPSTLKWAYFLEDEEYRSRVELRNKNKKIEDEMWMENEQKIRKEQEWKNQECLRKERKETKE